MKTIFTAAAVLLVSAALFIWTPARPQATPRNDIPSCQEIDEVRKIAGKDEQQIRSDIKTLSGIVGQTEPLSNHRRELGCALHGLGGFFYALGKMDSAILYTQKAANIRMGILRSGLTEADDPDRAAGSFHNLGIFYKEIEDNYAAVASFDSAITIYDRINSDKISDSYRDKGNALDMLGDFYEAKNNFSEAIRTARKANNTGLLVQAYIDMGKSLNYQGEYREALDTLKKALSLLHPANADDHYNLFVCYQNTGHAHLYLDSFSVANAHFSKALAHCEWADDSCRIFNYLSIVKRNTGDFKSAKAFLEKALVLAKSAGSTELIASTCDNLGEVSLAEKRNAEALRYFRLAQDTLLKGKKAAYLTNIVNKPDLFTYLFDEGRALCRLPGMDRLAIGVFAKADSLLDLMRREHRSVESKLIWRRDVSKLYELALDACYRGNDAEKALFFLEKSKSVLLLDDLAGLSARRILGDSLAAVEFNLQTALQDARKNYEEDPGQGWGPIQILENRLDAFRAYVSDTYPEYAKAKYDTKVVGLNEVRAFLPDTACFVQYFYGNSALFALVVAKNDPPRLVRIGKDKKLDAALHRFATFSASKDSIEAHTQEYFNLAYDIFDTIFAPALDFRYKKAIIVPDGPLAIIPFDALLTQPCTWDPVAGFAQAPYLIKSSLRTQIAWSATTLWRYQSSRASDKTLNHQLAFFAPDKFPPYLVPLNAGALLTQVQRTFGEKTYALSGAKKQASETSKKNSAHYSAFHFHTHAVARPASPPCLYFQMDSMRMDHFYRLKINADLFVLGACETNLGPYYSGEGVFSLSRGLASAGVSSIVSSLWVVPERSTVELFSDFYANLKRGMSKADALYYAKKNFLMKNAGNPALASPNAWAAWTFAGRDNALSFSPVTAGFTFGWWIAGLVLVALALLWFYRKFNWESL